MPTIGTAAGSANSATASAANNATEESSMHARKVQPGNTLARILTYLHHRRGQWIPNIELSMAVWTPSLSAAISELRANGHTIECQRFNGGFWYRLHTANNSAQVA